MSPNSAELVRRNEVYALSHELLPTIAEIKSTGAPPPKTCIVTCVDPRVFPEQLLGLRMGEAFLFRTIAGHPQPVFRDIITLDAVSECFNELILVWHTDCGAAYFDEPLVRSELSKTAPAVAEEIKTMELATLKASIEQSLCNDIRWLREQPLLRAELGKSIKGYIYDLRSGRLSEIKC